MPQSDCELQVTLNTLPVEQVAFSVLATVTSTQPKRRQIVIDAGGLALTRPHYAGWRP